MKLIYLLNPTLYQSCISLFTVNCPNTTSTKKPKKMRNSFFEFQKMTEVFIFGH